MVNIFLQEVPTCHSYMLSCVSNYVAGAPGATHTLQSVTHICERADWVVFLPREAQRLMPESIVEAPNYGCRVQSPRTLLAV